MLEEGSCFELYVVPEVGNVISQNQIRPFLHSVNTIMRYTIEIDANIIIFSPRLARDQEMTMMSSDCKRSEKMIYV